MPSDDVLTGAVETRDGIEVYRSYLESFDGVRLHVVRWSTDAAESDTGRPVVVLMHGYAEHLERYHELAQALVRAGHVVVGFDARGHGRSDGRRGYVERFEDYASDLRMLVSHVEVRYPGRRRVVLGHSNGGLIAIRFAQLYPDQLDGLIVTGPPLALRVRVPLWKAWAGRLLTNLWPTLAMPNDIRSEDLTRSPEIVAAHAADPLVNKVATARWFTEFAAAGERARAQAAQLRMPTWILQGGADRLVDPDATRAFAALLPASARFEELPAHFHEIFNEPDRAERYQQVIAWLAEHFPGERLSLPEASEHRGAATPSDVL